MSFVEELEFAFGPTATAVVVAVSETFKLWTERRFLGFLVGVCGVGGGDGDAGGGGMEYRLEALSCPLETRLRKPSPEDVAAERRG